MTPFSQMQIFFIISSVGFVVVGILAAVFLVYLIRAMNVFNGILDKMEKDIDKVSDTAKDMIEDIRDSVIFNFLFRHKKKRHKEH